MPLHNTKDGYGALTKLFHWLVVALFAFQFAAANIMIRMDAGSVVLGLGQAAYYNWHKSIGLVALVVAALRLWARRQGRLPDWAPCLGKAECAFIHRVEQVLYTAMFAMPISGYLYVMAGGYGVTLFGAWELPNPIGQWSALAAVARWTHILAGWALLLALAGHIGLVLRHQFILRDGLLWRMLPRRRTPNTAHVVPD